MGTHQTRRALIATAAALPAIIATPLKAETYTRPSDGELRRRAARDFIEQVANWHPRGRMVASHAMAMDLDPEDCVLIQLTDHSNPRALPIMHFQPSHRERVTVVVSATGAYEHGPVL